MKKYKEWLKDRLESLRETDVRMRKLYEPNSVEHRHFSGRLAAIDEVLDFIDELDEPEVLSQEWISDHIIFNEKEDAEYIYADKLQNLLVPKQELPVMPKYVGDWITKYRKVFGLYPALKKLEDSPLIWERIYKWYRMNTYKFVNAYLTGEYEVEEEPLYYALIKGHELVDDYDIYWNCDMFDDDVLVIGLQPSHDNFLTEMTEQEWFKIGINDSNADFVKVEE